MLPGQLEETETTVPQLAGTARYADIWKNKEESRGIGTVNSKHPMEAYQAITMFNGQLLCGRPMWIKIERENAS